jgi:hypothetical protein
MRLMSSVIFLGLMAAGLFVQAGPALAQQGREAEMRAAQPGPIHKHLAKKVGEYTTQTKFTAPGVATQESHGTAQITSALDGRFLLEENTGTFFGRPIKGMRLLGYNNASKKYEGIWTYTMSTGIMTLAGTSEDDGKTIKLTATYDGPMGEKQTLHVVTRDVDDDHFVVELTAKNPDGSKGASLETTYSRKK